MHRNQMSRSGGEGEREGAGSTLDLPSRMPHSDRIVSDDMAVTKDKNILRFHDTASKDTTSKRHYY